VNALKKDLPTGKQPIVSQKILAYQQSIAAATQKKSINKKTDVVENESVPKKAVVANTGGRIQQVVARTEKDRMEHAALAMAENEKKHKQSEGVAVPEDRTTKPAVRTFASRTVAKATEVPRESHSELGKRELTIQERMRARMIDEPEVVEEPKQE
jgi:hypothetical protein